MHEHHLCDRLLDEALGQARTHSAQLRGVRVRLGALSGSDPQHLRGDFRHVCQERGLGELELHVELAPEHPAGLELIGVVLAEPPAD